MAAAMFSARSLSQPADLASLSLTQPFLQALAQQPGG